MEEVSYGLIWGYLKNLTIFSAASLGDLWNVIYAIAFLIALYYTWQNGVLLNFILYILLNGLFVFAGLILGLIVGLLLFLIMGPFALIPAVVVAVLPVIWYRSQLVDSIVIALAWTMATGAASPIGLTPLVEAWFFVNYADGDYW